MPLLPKDFELMTTNMASRHTLLGWRLPFLSLVLAVMGVSCISSQLHIETSDKLTPTLRVQVKPGGNILDINIEDYIAGSIVAEADFRGLTPHQAHDVAQIQAILARTYALFNRDRHRSEGFDLCATTHCQVFKTPEQTQTDVTNLAVSAAKTTFGLVIEQAGVPINAVFHADCGGGTSAAEVVWGGHTPNYLQGVFDEFCLLNHPTTWKLRVQRSTLRDILSSSSLLNIGSQINSVYVTELDRTGRVVQVAVESDNTTTVVRGEQLRSVIARQLGPHSIKSSKFSVHLEADHFIFEGAGFGHGVGLCQRGATARIRAGHSPSQILNHYYPDTFLTRYY